MVASLSKIHNGVKPADICQYTANDCIDACATAHAYFSLGSQNLERERDIRTVASRDKKK